MPARQVKSKGKKPSMERLADAEGSIDQLSLLALDLVDNTSQMNAQLLAVSGKLNSLEEQLQGHAERLLEGHRSAVETRFAGIDRHFANISIAIERAVKTQDVKYQFLVDTLDSLSARLTHVEREQKESLTLIKAEQENIVTERAERHAKLSEIKDAIAMIEKQQLRCRLDISYMKDQWDQAETHAKLNDTKSLETSMNQRVQALTEELAEYRRQSLQIDRLHAQKHTDLARKLERLGGAVRSDIKQTNRTVDQLRLGFRRRLEDGKEGC